MNLYRLDTDGNTSSCDRLPNSVLLFGGAFDPPHLGHDQVLRELLGIPGAEAVRVIPTQAPRLKSRASTDWGTRSQWIEAWLQSMQVEFNAKTLIQTPVAGPAIETLRQLEKEAPSTHWTYAVGTDQLPFLKDWIEYPAFLSRAHWLWIGRKGYCGQGQKTFQKIFSDAVGNAQEGSQHFFLETDAPDVSSSMIWRLLEAHDPAALAFLPPSIRPYFESMLID